MMIRFQEPSDEDYHEYDQQNPEQQESNKLYAHTDPTKNSQSLKTIRLILIEMELEEFPFFLNIVTSYSWLLFGIGTLSFVIKETTTIRSKEAITPGIKP